MEERERSIMYLCDGEREGCKKTTCYKTVGNVEDACKHTTDVNHAKNFHQRCKKSAVLWEEETAPGK